MNLARKPNILFAIADDASHLGSGHAACLHTPAFDRVAAGGVLCRNTFTTNPKCAPSRACILTGRHTWQLEEAANHYSIFPVKFPVYPDLLEAAGYFVGHTGKGWAPGDYEKGGFTRNPAGPAWRKRKLTPPAQTGINTCDYAANFADFLADRPENRPFCFWYGGFEPHRPYILGEGARAGKRIEDATDIPPYLPDDPVVRNDILDYCNEIEWFDRHLGLMLERLEGEGELDNTLVVVTSDNGMPFPRLKGQMYEQDFHLPMAICWPVAIPGGRVVDDIISFIDLAPTFLEAAGAGIPPGVAGRSLLPVLLSEAEGRVDPERCVAYFGREKHDLGRERDLGYPVRCIRTEQFLYVRNFAPERWPAGNPETGYTNCDSSPTKEQVLALHERGISEYYHLCFGKRPAEELYDIQADPACMQNLIGNPAYREIRESLWVNLKKTLIETGDPRIRGCGDIFESYPYLGNDTHSWKAYMVKQWVKQRY